MMSQLVRFLTPDDQFTWSKEEIAKELPGFHFKGPGWYSSQGTWMLIIGTDTPDIYTLQVFYDRDPRSGYKAIAEAPVHSPILETTILKQPASYSGLIVLVVGLFIFVSLSGFILHRFQGWGILILMVFAFAWGRLARYVGNHGKKNEGKKDEQRTS